MAGGIRDGNISDNAQINPSKIAGGMGQLLRKGRKFLYVDGDFGGDSNSGKTVANPKKTIQAAVDAANNWDGIRVFPKSMASGATDPESYAETVIIPAELDGLSIIGVGTGRTQGGLPQVKIGAGSTAMFTIRAPGVVIANLGINGASSTGGGILLDDDGSTKTAFGVTISNCHFKNCNTHATNGATGGAIYASSTGGAWQLLVQSCRFYKCVGGIVLVGTSGSVPQDWVIDDCVFGTGVNTETDVDIYCAADGVIGLTIRGCDFATVDVPASGTIARYISLGAGTKGLISNSRFACISQGTGAKTFGAAGNACIIPTTVRISGCYGEPASDATGDSGDIYRT